MRALRICDSIDGYRYIMAAVWRANVFSSVIRYSDRD